MFSPCKKFFLNQECPSGLFEGGRVFFDNDDMVTFVVFVNRLPSGGRKATHGDVGLALLP